MDRWKVYSRVHCNVNLEFENKRNEHIWKVCLKCSLSLCYITIYYVLFEVFPSFCFHELGISSPGISSPSKELELGKYFQNISFFTALSGEGSRDCPTFTGTPPTQCKNFPNHWLLGISIIMRNSPPQLPTIIIIMIIIIMKNSPPQLPIIIIIMIIIIIIIMRNSPPQLPHLQHWPHNGRGAGWRPRPQDQHHLPALPLEAGQPPGAARDLQRGEGGVRDV